jgi:hypothetical protein
MEYMLLLYADGAAFDAIPPAQKQEAVAAYGAYTQALEKAGVLRASGRLRPTQTATSISNLKGKTEVLNGPFAETKEQLAGYYLIDTPDLDAALNWAGRCPTVNHGIVEVRPIWPREEY